MKLQICRAIKNQIPSQIFSCEFREISHSKLFKEPFGWLLLHKDSLYLLSHHDLSPFQKRFHIYFPTENFLDWVQG